MFSCEIYKISKNAFFYRAATVVGLTRVFKGDWGKNWCECIQYIPDLAEKGISCRENAEVATLDVP